MISCQKEREVKIVSLPAGDYALRGLEILFPLAYIPTTFYSDHYPVMTLAAHQLLYIGRLQYDAREEGRLIYMDFKPFNDFDEDRDQIKSMAPNVPMSSYGFLYWD